ncbi:MAG: glycosyltransferase [Pseudodesulfovibrio sp.]
MNRLDFPAALPPCPRLLPLLKDRFSGWQLGMGRADTLVGLIEGVHRLAQDQPACRPMLPGMALWTMQSHPLSPGTAQWCARLTAENLALSPHLAALAARMLLAMPLADGDAEDMGTWYAVVRQDDHALTLRFLSLVLGIPNKGLAWLAHCWQDLLFLGRPDVTRSALDLFPWDEATRPLQDRLMAEWAFHSLPPDEALESVLALDPADWGLWRTYAGAELLLRAGRKGEAKGALAQLWKTLPWHVNLTLKLHDLFHPAPPADPARTGEAAVLLYSWNKADLLADTLASLEASALGDAPVFALDNGSTDATPDVLRAARDRFGADRFHVETLPVNVGAPAARNWLLSLAGVRARRFAAFLDDDVVLPENWLRRLLGVAGNNPGAGAVGCRITAAAPPYGLQSADYNLFPQQPKPTEPGMLPNRVLICDNCANSPDTGLFTYTRPCLSVSGCCHLVSLAAVEAAGGFDLRYTPSQFDDLDRDLRSALAGMPAVYAGGLAVRHVQHSSLAKARTTRQIGHVMGNKFKLDTKYSDEELAALASDNRDRLWRDLDAKYRTLSDRLGLRF